MMRILQVHNINQVATTYNAGLAQLGHTTALYEPCLKGGFAPLPQKLAMMPWRVLDMRHIVGKLHPNYFDIVHIHWASYGMLGLAGQIPFIVHCHGSDVRYRLQQSVFRPLLSGIFRRAAAVLCITPDLLPVVQSVRSDVIFSPAPIDTARFVPAEEMSQPARPWTILLFARLDPDKGVNMATQGIACFARRHPDVRVKLLDWGLLKEQIKQRYRARFDFVPLVAPESVPHLIGSADVIVGQFALGALGLAELQAMSCGKPVIASFRFEECYPEPPPLCQAATAEEIDESLENLYQHPQAGAALGQKAREWTVRYHEQRVFVSKLEKLYRSLLT